MEEINQEIINLETVFEKEFYNLSPSQMLSVSTRISSLARRAAKAAETAASSY